MESLFPRDSSFDKVSPDLTYDEHLANLTQDELRVASTRKLGVAEVPVRDLEEILFTLRTASYEADDSGATRVSQSLNEMIDRLYSYLPG